MLLAVTPKIAIAVENALKYREADERAKIDSLTGLPNRQLLREALDTELARAHRLQQPLAVIHCRLTQTVPDSHPRHIVDDTLCALGAALKADGRQYDHIGRVADNEFALVLPGVSPECAPAKQIRLWEIWQLIRSTHLGFEFSVGQSTYPEDGDGAGHLLALAARRSAPIGAPKLSAAPLASLHRAVRAQDRPLQPSR
jgi:diguanylate cyclase (GGDEF)-like protein